ncbi:MAG: uroporphyrinogen-III synthase [Bacillaceae bacterium]
MMNKKILITRDEGINGRLQRGIEQLGAIPIVIPFIKVKETPVVVDNLSQYDWIFFTSINSVKAFLNYNQLPSHIKIGAVGSKTKQAIETFGYEVTFMPSVFTAQCFIKEITTQLTKEDRILFPRGNRARDTIFILREQGYRLFDMIVYETSFVIPDNEVLQGISEIDGIIFASPSAVTAFCQCIPNWNKEIYIVCIGPTTAEQAKNKGFTNIHIPAVYTSEGIVDEMKRSFGK